MRVHRIDALLHWLFTKLALPVLALCLLSQTLKLVQLSDTGLPAAVLDELQYLHSLSSPNETLEPSELAHYCCLWEIRKAFVPFTIWLGMVLSSACRHMWDLTIYNDLFTTSVWRISM